MTESHYGNDWIKAITNEFTNENFLLVAVEMYDGKVAKAHMMYMGKSVDFFTLVPGFLLWLLAYKFNNLIC